MKSSVPGCSIWRKISSININVGLRLYPSLTCDPTECWRWTVVLTLPVFGSCCCTSGVSPLWASPVTVPSPAGLPSWSRHFQSMPRTTRAPGTMYFITCERNSRRWRRRLASASFTALPADAETPAEREFQLVWLPSSSSHFFGCLYYFDALLMTHADTMISKISNIHYLCTKHGNKQSLSLPIRSERLR